MPARTLPGSPILLSDNEVIWRQYQVVLLRTAKQGEGTLYVTDSRVVFYARATGRGTQRPSKLVQQTKLEDITGLATYVSHRVSLLFAAAAAFFLFLALISYEVGQQYGNSTGLTTVLFLVLAVACVVAILLGRAKHGAVGVEIHSRATQASPIVFGRFGQRRGLVASFLNALIAPLRAIFGVFTAADVPHGRPGENAEDLVAELGALILDLQTRGSMAGEHWGVDAGQSQAPGPARSV